MNEAGAALIIGAGGLGCPAALALAAAGVQDITVVDDDVVDETNLHRQVLHSHADVGVLKVESLAHALERRFPRVRVEPFAARFDATNAIALVSSHDVVVDGSDNFATKFVANDACVLAKKPLVHAAAVGTGGQLLTIPAGGQPCYRCLFEELPPPGVGPSCAEAGVLGPVPGVLGALQGAEAARILGGQIGSFVGRLVQYDALGMTVRSVRFNPNPTCAVCGAAPRIRALDAAEYPTGTGAGCSPLS
ncbi:MAG TPA: HesA/MoeB/ThiF family protein [Polyangia bacterium]|nr:HesA/MoeB/ThiF family protein [Polyangia bacterium]